MIKNELYGDVIIKCPVCQFHHTHHEDVSVFERDGGEDKQTIVKEPGRAGYKLSEHNPSTRRGAVSVGFLGECGHHFTMNIIQHKGRTIIEFESE